MIEIEAPTTARARVCVPNTAIGIVDRHERAVFSQDVVRSVLDAARLKCVREAGPKVCKLAYVDITVLTSDFEEIGYASCDGGQNSCVDIVSETAIAIIESLESTHS